MPRRNGSYFGLTVAPTISAASGIWRVREAEENLRVNKWPATPGVPGSPVAVPGNAQASLTWSAPTLGTPPTDYQVQYSSNSGTTWTTFSDGTSTAASAVVTGLTNDTGYIFRVRAVNALGEGPYGAASGVVTPAALDTNLLLHFNGSNGSTTFTDSSGYTRSVTSNGGAALSTAQSKFGGASGFFEGSDDYLSLALSMNWDADFTVEFWLYRAGAGGGAVNVLFAAGNIQSGVGGINLYTDSTGEFSWNDGFAGAIAGGNAPLNQWVHVAAVRSGGTNTLYVDGTSVGTSAQTFPVTNSVVEIGGTPRYGFYTNGYIDEFRIVAGTAVYTSNFTPPTAPFPNPPVVPQLLLRFNGSNGSTTFTDSSPNGLTVTAIGSAAISTAQSKWGGSSLNPDGGRLTIPDHESLDFGVGDFTVECWVRINGYSGNNQCPFAKNGNDDWSAGYGWELFASSALFLCAGATITCDPIPTGQWVHLAVTRGDGLVKAYADGLLIGSGAAAGNLGNAYDLTVGNREITLQGGWVRPFVGYIDDLRIVKGTAMYTGNFTPPTAPF